MQWTGWHNRPLNHGKNLYLDWFRTVIGNQAGNLDFPSIIPGLGHTVQYISGQSVQIDFAKVDFSKIDFSKINLSAIDPSKNEFLKIALPEPEPHSAGSIALELPLATTLRIRELYGPDVASPDFANNELDLPGLGGTASVLNRIPDLAPETVIVGIIDTGIALGHRRTRLPENGGTRFLAAWQQSADTSSLHAQDRHQRLLPFGRELFADDINELLDEHSVGGKADGWLDEDAFNRAAGLVDYRNAYGDRSLGRRVAHGTHVMDRAIGFDPSEEPDLAENVRMIGVNLPGPAFIGASGGLLELPVMMGIARIVQISEALADRAKDNGRPPKHGTHYPLIINFAYGKQAGPRDGAGPVEDLIDKINNNPERTLAGASIDKGAVYVAIPAGNDNLLRGNAAIMLKAEEEEEIKWRVLPEDHSANYVEIWSDEISESELNSKNHAIDAINLSIEMPNGIMWNSEKAEALSANKNDVFVNDFETRVRVYFRLKQGVTSYRIHYLICAAPTLNQDDANLAEDGLPRTAPAGLWRIKLKNMLNREICMSANVQTDQSALPDGITGLRSYFDDEDYRQFDETTGRPLDTYPYPSDERSIRRRAASESADAGSDNEQAIVKRHGTLNALAVDRDFTIVTGGYRAADGAPVDYSATGGADVVKQQKGFLKEPTLALVADEGAAHPGILSAGARDGSTVAMRGTSVAAPQITRKIVDLLMEGETDLDPKAWIKEQAADDGLIGKNDRCFRGDTKKGKTGEGRYPHSHYRGSKRLGWEDDRNCEDEVS